MDMDGSDSCGSSESSYTKCVQEVNASWRAWETSDSAEASGDESESSATSTGRVARDLKGATSSSGSNGRRADVIGGHVSSPHTSEDGDNKETNGGNTNPARQTLASFQEHLAQRCDPCVFYNSVLGCVKEDQCNYCHYDHDYLNNPLTFPNRLRKQTRNRIKWRIQQYLQLPFEQGQDSLQAEARQHTYARRVISGFLDEPQQPETELQQQPLTPGFVRR